MAFPFIETSAASSLLFLSVSVVVAVIAVVTGRRLAHAMEPRFCPSSWEWLLLLPSVPLALLASGVSSTPALFRLLLLTLLVGVGIVISLTDLTTRYIASYLIYGAVLVSIGLRWLIDGSPLPAVLGSVLGILFWGGIALLGRLYVRLRVRGVQTTKPASVPVPNTQPVEAPAEEPLLAPLLVRLEIGLFVSAATIALFGQVTRQIDPDQGEGVFLIALLLWTIGAVLCALVVRRRSGTAVDHPSTAESETETPLTEGFAFGDVELSALLGACLGPLFVLQGSFITILFGGVVSVMLLIAGRGAGRTMSFGQYMVLGIWFLSAHILAPMS